MNYLEILALIPPAPFIFDTPEREGAWRRKDATDYAMDLVNNNIHRRYLAAQERGRALAEHHRRAQAQRWRWLERELRNE